MALPFRPWRPTTTWAVPPACGPSCSTRSSSRGPEADRNRVTKAGVFLTRVVGRMRRPDAPMGPNAVKAAKLTKKVTGRFGFDDDVAEVFVALAAAIADEATDMYADELADAARAGAGAAGRFAWANHDGRLRQGAGPARHLVRRRGRAGGGHRPGRLRAGPRPAPPPRPPVGRRRRRGGRGPGLHRHGRHLGRARGAGPVGRHRGGRDLRPGLGAGRQVPGRGPRAVARRADRRAGRHQRRRRVRPHPSRGGPHAAHRRAPPPRRHPRAPGRACGWRRSPPSSARRWSRAASPRGASCGPRGTGCGRRATSSRPTTSR